jgi:hypothetical protein
MPVCAGVVRRLQARKCERSGTLELKVKAEYMADLFNLVMLVCAAVGSMALGVLLAYGIFRVGFAAMRPRRQSAPVKAQPEAVRAL